MYLLSDGTTTNNIVTYISDVIRLNMSLRVDQVPNFTGGTSDELDTIRVDQIKDKLTKIVEKILDRLRDQHPKINLNLTTIDISTNPIKIEIDINGVKVNYDITTRNIQ